MTTLIAKIDRNLRILAVFFQDILPTSVTSHLARFPALRLFRYTEHLLNQEEGRQSSAHIVTLVEQLQAGTLADPFSASPPS